MSVERPSTEPRVQQRVCSHRPTFLLRTRCQRHVSALCSVTGIWGQVGTKAASPGPEAGPSKPRTPAPTAPLGRRRPSDFHLLVTKHPRTAVALAKMETSLGWGRPLRLPGEAGPGLAQEPRRPCRLLSSHSHLPKPVPAQAPSQVDTDVPVQNIPDGLYKCQSGLLS